VAVLTHAGQQLHSRAFLRGALVAAATVATLTACGGGGDSAAAEAAPSTSAAAVIDPEGYAADVIEAFKATYPTNPELGDRGEPSDWQAFVRVVEDLEPPEGQELKHEQMLAGFEAYVDADLEAEDVCERTPGPGGQCFVAVSEASDQWAAALIRAYELPGLSHSVFLG